MTNREAIEQLKFDMEMILFNPNTGEKLTLEQVKLRNEDNYKTYLADQMAIAALEEQEERLEAQRQDEETWNAMQNEWDKIKKKYGLEDAE